MSSQQQCFSTRDELHQAIDLYLYNSSAANSPLSQQYGHPIGSWCFDATLQDFSAIFDSFRTSSITGQRLYEASNFNEPLDGWDVSHATNLSYAFRATRLFNQDLGSWQVDAVTDLRETFDGASVFEGQGLENWNAAKVTTFFATFRWAKVMNADLSSWDLTSAVSLGAMFNHALEFNNTNLNAWQVDKVTHMHDLFHGAVLFNGDITRWNTERVVDMKKMFQEAYSFDQDLSGWNVTKALAGDNGVANIFQNASSFSQNLCAWSEQLPTDAKQLPLMFVGTSCPEQENLLSNFCYDCNATTDDDDLYLSPAVTSDSNNNATTSTDTNNATLTLDISEAPTVADFSEAPSLSDVNATTVEVASSNATSANETTTASLNVTSGPPIASDLPTVAPLASPVPLSPAPTSLAPTPSPVTVTIANIQSKFLGVPELDTLAISEWIQVTEAWFMDSYNHRHASDRLLRSLRPVNKLQEESGVSGMHAKIFFAKQDPNPDENSNTLTYNQSLTYTLSDPDTEPEVEDLIELPYKLNATNDQYSGMLTATIPRQFAQMQTPVPLPTIGEIVAPPPAFAPTSSEDDGASIGAIDPLWDLRDTDGSGGLPPGLAGSHAENNESGGGGVSTGAMVGLIIAALAGLALLGYCVYKLIQWSRARRRERLAAGAGWTEHHGKRGSKALGIAGVPQLRPDMSSASMRRTQFSNHGGSPRGVPPGKAIS